MKKKRNRNPIFEQAYLQGREDEKKRCAALFNDFLKERFEQLDKVPGIGEKTKHKLYDHFMEVLDGGR